MESGDHSRKHVYGQGQARTPRQRLSVSFVDHYDVDLGVIDLDNLERSGRHVLARRRRCRFDAQGIPLAQGSRPFRDRRYAGSNGSTIRQRVAGGGALGMNFVGQPFQCRSVRRKVDLTNALCDERFDFLIE